MLDLKMCPKCTKLTAKENDVCPYCGNHFERRPTEPEILSSPRDSPEPTVPSESKPPGDSNSIWYELNSLTQWAIIIFILLALLGNPIMGIIGAIIGYFWLGPWAGNFAKEHNRSINWAYSFGFLFAFLGCGLYWVYVRMTTDPVVSPVSMRRKDTTVGEWTVLILSLIYALFATFTESNNESLSEVFGFFLGSFILSLIVLLILYWIITRLYPKSTYWGIVTWFLAIIGISFIIFIILVFLVAFIYGMAGIAPYDPSSTSITYTTYENPGLGYKINYPDTWTYTTINEPDANYITDTTFSSKDGKKAVLVQVVDLSGTAFQMSSLDEWTKNAIALLRSKNDYSQLTIQKNERITFAGYPAQRLEYTFVMNTGTKVLNIEYLVIKGTKGYNIGVTSTEDEYNDWSSSAQQIIDSFEITA